MPASVKMTRATKAVAGMYFSDLTVPIVLPESPKLYDYGDLPFKPVTPGQTSASLKTVMVVKKFGAMTDNGPQPMPDLAVVKEVYLADGMDGFVGQTMGLAGSVPSGTVQWCILNDEERGWYEGCHASGIPQEGYGCNAAEIDNAMIGSPRNVAIPTHFMFENMGGALLLTRTLSVSDKANGIERSLSTEDIDQGLAYDIWLSAGLRVLARYSPLI
eukprot:4522925-Amphidinium_carterae.2